MLENSWSLNFIVKTWWDCGMVKILWELSDEFSWAIKWCQVEMHNGIVLYVVCDFIWLWEVRLDTCWKLAKLPPALIMPATLKTLVEFFSERRDCVYKTQPCFLGQGTHIYFHSVPSGLNNSYLWLIFDRLETTSSLGLNNFSICDSYFIVWKSLHLVGSIHLVSCEYGIELSGFIICGICLYVIDIWSPKNHCNSFIFFFLLFFFVGFVPLVSIND